MSICGPLVIVLALMQEIVSFASVAVDDDDDNDDDDDGSISRPTVCL